MFNTRILSDVLLSPSQRTCVSRMNPGSKRLRLSPSKHPGPSPTAGPPSSSPPRFFHDALPLSLAAGSRVEEEEEGYLVVEEDATDSSLIITMGRASFLSLS